MKALYFCLSLLVLLTPLDDALASGTPEVDDDVWAVQNDQFLVHVARKERHPQRLLLFFPHPFSSQPTVATPTLSPGGLQAEIHPPGLAGPDLLYTLMSFQR
jgi:hypothetical protein